MCSYYTVFTATFKTSVKLQVLTRKYTEGTFIYMDKALSIDKS